MGAIEIIGMVIAGAFILLLILAICCFLASLLYFHDKWERQEESDREEMGRAGKKDNDSHI